MSSDDTIPNQFIEVCIEITGSFHIGGTEYSPNSVDLPILKQYSPALKRKIPIIPPSSFKGILRSSVEKAARYSLKSNIDETIISLFGSPLGSTRGARTIPGVLQVYPSLSCTPQITDDMIRTRTSIRVDRKYGSVVSGSLWQYEFVSSETPITIGYDIHFLYPLRNLAAAVLLAGIRLLRYDFIGGLGSRGLGLITNVEIKPTDFVDRVQPILEGLFND